MTEHVCGSQGWYAVLPMLLGCLCGSCHSDVDSERRLICDGLVEVSDDNGLTSYRVDCEHEIGPNDRENFEELWRNARF